MQNAVFEKNTAFCVDKRFFLEYNTSIETDD